MPDTGNVPVQILQGGSVLNIASGGTALIASGGSIQIPTGGVLSVAGSIVMQAGGAFNNAAGTSTSAGLTIVASGGTHLYNAGGSLQVANGGAISVGSVNGFSAPNGITLGGTQGRWAFGTFGLNAGVGTVATGLTTVVAVSSSPVSAVQGGLGSMTAAVVDMSLFASGSIIFRGLAGTLAFTGSNGTVAWMAFGN